MGEWHRQLAEWSIWWWSLIIPHLYQVTIFAGATWIITRTFKITSARLRYLVWVVVLVKFFLPTVLLSHFIKQIGINFTGQSVNWQFSDSLQQPVVMMMELVDIEPPTPSAVQHNEFTCIFSVLWLTGMSFLLVRWHRARRNLIKHLLQWEQIEHTAEAIALQEIRTQLRLKRQVALAAANEPIDVGVWGIWKPIIILPKEILTKLSKQQIQTIFMHELMHVIRWDNLIGVLQRWLCCLFWFHPLVWWLDRRLLNERELACDERVLGTGCAPIFYASSLWRVSEQSLGWRSTVGRSLTTGANLKRRVEIIMNYNYQSKKSLVSYLPVWLTLAGVAVITALLGATPTGYLKAKAQGPQQLEQSSSQLGEFIPVRVENSESLPFEITWAQLQFNRADTAATELPRRYDNFEIELHVANQSDRPISGFVLEMSSSVSSKKFFSLAAMPTLAPLSGRVFKNHIALPKKTWLATLPKGWQSCAACALSEFQIRVVGVIFGSGERFKPTADTEWKWADIAIEKKYEKEFREGGGALTYSIDRSNNKYQALIVHGQ